MGTVTIAPQSLLRELSVAGSKPMLRGIHHLALVTDDMRMTLDFYVRVLGMPIVHGLRTPSRPPRHEPYARERCAALPEHCPLFS
jgi:catechol-2,3-dioxygenase